MVGSIGKITLQRLAPLLLLVASFNCCVELSAQNNQAAEADKLEKGMIQLTLPPETELKVLIDYVSQRLGVQILYDEKVSGKKISVRAPGPIPADSLLNVLESALKMKGFALVDADIPGWKRIEEVKDLSQIAETELDPAQMKQLGTKVLTQTFHLKYMKPELVKGIVEPFLTKQGANTIMLAEQNLLIITDYAKNLERIEGLIKKIDQAGPEKSLTFYEVQHLPATQLAPQISRSLVTQAGEEGSVDISVDARTNQLLIVGQPDQIKAVMQLAKALDVNLGQSKKIYSFRYVNAERIDRLVREIFDPLTIERFYRSAVDSEDNLLITSATEPIHEKLTWLQEKMDVETKRPGSAVKIYKLKFADAQEVLNTMRAVEGQAQTGDPSFRRGISPLGRGGVGNARNNGEQEGPIDYVPGANVPETPGEPSPAPPALQPEPGTAAPAVLPPGTNSFQDRMSTIVPGSARVSVDPNTNSIIVIAERSVQEVYADLIKSLDKKRPQVMIEAKVVVLDTSDDFSLGIEISGGDRLGAGKLLQFTSYGLSTVNPATGALSLIPGRGFNWTLVDPDSADAVLKALSTHRRAKILSAPRIMVNDNSLGSLASVSEVPFTSVNASNTVSTTSFAGFAEAGTTIEVKPRVTANDQLQLEYGITLNSFTGTGGGGVPPPRQTDEIKSNVSIPDGYTVIVGGLTRRNYSQSEEGIPFIEKIPVLKELTRIVSETQSQTTLFIFLRPVILRDDKFRDLKYLSDRDLPLAREKGNYPTSAPLLIR